MIQINEFQKSIYEDLENKIAKKLIDRYTVVLEKVKNNKEINVLDIGGASGHFAFGLYNYFSGANCNITVIDAAQYDTWKTYSDKITFIKCHANNLSELFSRECFDLIFVNRAFHHFVMPTWKESIKVITNIFGQIMMLLKVNGYLCIVDHFYNGLFFDASASKIIFKLTSCKIPLAINMFRRMEATSAGIGVCFLSKKMWYKIFKDNKLDLIYIDEKKNKPKGKKIKMLFYKLCLLVKDRQADIVMVLKKVERINYNENFS